MQQHLRFPAAAPIGLNQAPQRKEFASGGFHHAGQRHLPTVSVTMAVQSSPYFIG